MKRSEVPNIIIFPDLITDFICPLVTIQTLLLNHGVLLVHLKHLLSQKLLLVGLVLCVLIKLFLNIIDHVHYNILSELVLVLNIEPHLLHV